MVKRRPWVSYYENGHLEEEGVYINGKEGSWVRFYYIIKVNYKCNFFVKKIVHPNIVIPNWTIRI